MLAHLATRLVAMAVDERSVEQAVADALGRCSPSPGDGAGSPRSPGRGRRVGGRRRRPVTAATRFSRIVVTTASCSSIALLGDEDAHQRVLQLGRHAEGVDPVVGDGTCEPLGEPRRDALALGVERSQVVVEVLTGTALARRGRRPADARASGRMRSAKTCRTAASPSVESSARERVSPPACAAASGTSKPSRNARTVSTGRSLADRSSPGASNSSNVIGGAASSAGDVPARLDAQQRRAAVDLNVAGDEHVGDRAADRGGDGDLHLHRLDDGDPVAGRHDVARSVRRHRRRGRSPGHAGCRRRRGRTGGLRRRPRPGGWRRRSPTRRRSGARRWSAGCGPDRAIARVTTSIVAVVPDDERDAAEAANDQTVGGRSVAQLDLRAPSALDCGRPRLGPAEEPVAIDGMQLIGGVERGRHEGDVGVMRSACGRRSAVNRSSQPVSMSPATDLRSFEESEQERLVRRSAADDDHHLRQRPPKARQRLLAVAAVRR